MIDKRAAFTVAIAMGRLPFILFNEDEHGIDMMVAAPEGGLMIQVGKADPVTLDNGQAAMLRDFIVKCLADQQD